MTTKIEWTDETWNPVRGCSLVSAGCANCYAMKQAHRFSGEGMPYAGLTELGPQGPRWTGKIRLVPEVLDAPLHWKTPRRIFVNSMSDLFHEDVPDEFIVAVFGVMAACPEHTFQILTKRPERMRQWFDRIGKFGGFGRYIRSIRVDGDRTIPNLFGAVAKTEIVRGKRCRAMSDPWMKVFNAASFHMNDSRLRNVSLGVSVEDQQTADARIPILLQTPAAVRFVSAEPLLGPVDIAPWLRATTKHHFRADIEGMLRNRAFVGLQHDDGRPMSRREAENELFALHAKGVKYIPASSCDAFDPEDGCKGHPEPRLDWVIVGGESGPGARPCDIAWIRSIVEQCRSAAVPCFVKQLGAYPKDHCVAGTPIESTGLRFPLKDKKGGDPAEWPADLRVREWPR